MKKTAILAGAMAVLVFASMAMGQTNARVRSLGSPNVGGINLMNDVSDVVRFPNDVATYSNMMQGVADVDSGYVYASKSVLDFLSIGFLFGKRLYVTETEFSTVLGGARTAANGYLFQNGAPTVGRLPVNGAFTVPAIPDVSNQFVGHLLVGLKMGDVLTIGADLFREAFNNSVDNKIVTQVGAADQTDTEKGTVSYGSLGLNAGVGLKIGVVALKLSTGFVNLGYSADYTYTRSVSPAGATTYNTENSTLKASSGYYLPFSAKAGLELGSHTFIAGIDIEKTGYAFEATFDDGDPGTVTAASYKTDDYSGLGMGLGVADEFKLEENTNIIGSLVAERASMTTTPDPKNSYRPASTTTITTFPRTSLGVEHVLNNVWKFDQVKLRAGGSKTWSWDGSSSEGGSTSTDVSNTPSGSSFDWTTGVGLVVGKFDLSMTIGAEHWNGVYFISGNNAGPFGTWVTMTYDFSKK